jgi:hypothetical protein
MKPFLLATLLLASAQDSPKTAMAVWDTGTSLAAFSEKTGWMEVARDQTLASFKGDAVVTNGRVVLIVRRKEAALELCSVDGAPRTRIVLQAAGGDPVARLTRTALVENSRGGAILKIDGKTAKGAAVAAKLRLKRGEVSVEIEPGAGAAQVRVETPSRYVVLPDFFADDIVIDARKVPLPSLDLPSENFLLHLGGKDDTIVIAIFEHREQDVRVSLSGQDDERRITGSEIEFGKDKKVWVALLAAPQVWHARDLAKEDGGKVLNLDWKMPFPAHWRVDFTTSRDLIDSWSMLLPDTRGFIKPAWLGSGPEGIKGDRKRWTTVLGSFLYPCWSDADTFALASTTTRNSAER